MYEKNRYIPPAANFFAFSLTLQLLIFILAGSLASGVTAIGRRARKHRARKRSS